MSPYSTPPDLVPSSNVPGSPHAAVRGKKGVKCTSEEVLVVNSYMNVSLYRIQINGDWNYNKYIFRKNECLVSDGCLIVI